MRIAITGISGFIGSHIAKVLSERGHAVVGLVRETSRRDHIQPYVERLVVGDQDDEVAWELLLNRADAVVHASVDWSALRPAPDLDRHLKTNLAGSIRFLQASRPRPFVFLSTIAVHHDILPQWRGKPDEAHPLRPNSLYGAYKASVEAHLWAEHFSQAGPDGGPRHTAAIRPCAVYGIDPNLPRSHGYDIIKTLRETGRYDKPGGGKCVHVDDVALATALALEKPEAAGQPFNLADCYARHADWAEIAAQELGIEAEIDLSSPPSSKNLFDKSATQRLGVPLNRGHEGIRQHLRDLISKM